MLHLTSFDNKGTTLASVLVGIALSIATSLTVLELLNIDYMAKRKALREIEKIDLKKEATALLLRNDVCSCHLDPKKNLEDADVLRISGGSKIKPIVLSSLRSTCDFSNLTNIIAHTGDPLRGSKTGLVIDKITIENIRFVEPPRRYLGDLTISFLAELREAPVSPIVMTFGFEVSDVKGGPVEDETKQCFRAPSPNALVACPDGFLMGGPVGSFNNFCIDGTDRPGIAYSTAEKICEAIDVPGYGIGSLCDTRSLDVACDLNLISTSKWLMVHKLSGMPSASIVQGGDGCGSGGVINGYTDYRCCIK